MASSVGILGRLASPATTPPFLAEDLYGANPNNPDDYGQFEDTQQQDQQQIDSSPQGGGEPPPQQSQPSDPPPPPSATTPPPSGPPTAGQVAPADAPAPITSPEAPAINYAAALGPAPASGQTAQVSFPQVPAAPPESRATVSFPQTGQPNIQSGQTLSAPPSPSNDTPITDELIKLTKQHYDAIAKNHPSVAKKIIAGLVGMFMPQLANEIVNPGDAAYAKQAAALAPGAKLEETRLTNLARADNYQTNAYLRQQAQAQAERNERERQSRDQQAEQDRFTGRGGVIGSPEDLMIPAQDYSQSPAPITSPETPAPPVGPVQPPSLSDLPLRTSPLGIRANLSVPASVPPGYVKVPSGPGDQPGTMRMQPTAAEVARQKKVADQANWLPTPAPIKNLYPNAPDTMPPQVLDSYTRLLQSGDKDAADRQLRRDIADQSNETRRDIAAQNAQARAEAAATSGGRADTVALDRQVKQFGAPYQRMYDGVNSQLDKILDAEKMISGGAVDQALGVPKVLTALVSGQGSGVRITQPELQAIYKSRGITGDVEGWWNSITGQGKLTKDQQKQLGLILGDVRQRIQSKQQIVQDTLDKINGASGRQEIVAADKDARDRLRALESPQQQTQLPPQAAAQLKEGIHTTFGNGQTWTLKNGQPNQVK